VLRTPTKLLDDASSAHRKLGPADGLHDAQLDNGARVHIVHGNVASIWHVLVNVRKFIGIPQERCHPRRQAPLEQVERREPACVQARLSIVLAGHPGAGKTTLMSCTAAELDPALRVVVAEEVFGADIRIRPTVSVSGNA
jgi:pilus assembly protein CpaF